MTENIQAYSGTDVLENMLDAKIYNNFLVKQVNRHIPKSVSNIVDFGAGIGTIAKELQSMDKDVHCIELDNRNRSLLKKSGLEVSASLDGLPDESVDFCYSLNVLEHIKEDQETIELIYKKLKKGGKFYVYVPAFMCLFSSFDLRLGHVRRYRKNDLIEKLRRSNFQVEKACYVDSLGFFAALFYKMLDDGSAKLSGTQVRIYDRIGFPISRFMDLFFSPFFGKNVEIIATKKVK